MGRKRHLGFSTFTVLRAVERGYRYGFDIMDAAGLPAGTVYPALSRMQELGLVRSRWEDTKIAQREKRPARRYYQITAAGEVRLQEEVEHYGALERLEERGGATRAQRGSAKAR